MGALANAASLMKDEQFSALAKAASVYQATKVMEEASTVPDYAQRRMLAMEVLNNPDFILARLVSILAGTPTIATQSADATAIVENDIITRTAAVWTQMAKLVFEG